MVGLAVVLAGVAWSRKHQTDAGVGLAVGPAEGPHETKKVKRGLPVRSRSAFVSNQRLRHVAPLLKDRIDSL